MKIRSKSEEPRDAMLTIRVSESEKEQLKKKAALLGVSVGGYLLGLALGDMAGKVILDKRGSFKVD